MTLWAQLAATSAGMGLSSLIAYLVGRAKNKAEIAKLYTEREHMQAEVGRVVAETYDGLIAALRAELDRLRARVDELELINARYRQVLESSSHDH